MSSYANAEETFEVALLSALKPRPILTVWEWADQFRILPRKTSSEAGKWRTQRTPYLKEIMDELSYTSPSDKVVLKKGTQVGGTECGINWVGYTIDYDPCTMMVVWPSLPDVKKNSKLRITPLIEDTPEIKAKVGSGNKRDEQNTAMFKEFDDGALVLTGAHSASGLRSVPSKKQLLDELDAFPDDVEGEGDAVGLVEKRSSTFSDRKMFLVSTPVEKHRSKIHKEWLLSDQRWYYVPCPHCKGMQILGHEDSDNPLSVFNYLSYKTEEVIIGDDKIQMVTDASMFCKHCGEEIQEHHKTFMLNNGEWRKHNPKSQTPGFFLSGVYSPLGWHSWKKLCENYVKYLNSQDESDLKLFINTDLGEVYESKGTRPAEDALYQRRENYEIGIVPRGPIFLTCAVDVQDDRLEAEVVGWARRKERWSIERKVIVGDPKDEETWDELESYITQTFHHVDGYEMSLSKVVIDSGYKAQEVYDFCGRFDPKRVMPIKGRAEMVQMVSTPTSVNVRQNGKRVRSGVKLWHVGTNIIKSGLYGDLQKEEPENIEDPYPPGFIHFPMYEREYFLQLTAEEKHLVKDKKGYKKVEWRKKRDRNETLDLHVYNRAAASMVGIDRFKEQHWTKLEAQINVVKKLQRTENKNSKQSDKRKKKKRNRKNTGYW